MNSEKAREILLVEINYLMNNEGNKEVIECYKILMEDSLELESWKKYAAELEEAYYD